MATTKKGIGRQSRIEFARLTVDRFMETHVQSALPRTKADVAVSMMIEGFASVPIVDEQQRLVGIVSERRNI